MTNYRPSREFYFQRIEHYQTLMQFIMQCLVAPYNIPIHYCMLFAATFMRRIYTLRIARQL